MADHVKHLPESLQLKILSLVATNAPASDTGDAASAAGDAVSGDHHAWARGLAARFIAHGIAWQDEMAPLDTVSRPMLNEIRALPDSALAPAGMGASVVKWRDTSARGDSICWVPLAGASALPASSPLCALTASAGWAWLRATLGEVVAAIQNAARIAVRKY